MKNPLPKKVLLGFMLLAATGTALFLVYQPSSEEATLRKKPYFCQVLEKEEPKHPDNPGAYAKYHRAIRTKYGEEAPDYQPNFAVREGFVA